MLNHINSFRRKTRRLGPVRQIERVSSSHLETVTLLREGSRVNANPIAAAISMVRWHLPLRQAKDAAELPSTERSRW